MLYNVLYNLQKLTHIYIYIYIYIYFCFHNFRFYARVTERMCRFKLCLENCNKAMQNNYRGQRLRGWRTPEYVTKMMNAFWFPFPRFPPRWYAGAGAHYHKALICQTPWRLSAKVASVSPWNSGRTWDRKRAVAALDMRVERGSLKDTSIGSFSRAVPIWERILSSLRDINARRCRVFREMEWICQPIEDIARGIGFVPSLASKTFSSWIESFLIPFYRIYEWKREDWFMW